MKAVYELIADKMGCDIDIISEEMDLETYLGIDRYDFIQKFEKKNEQELTRRVVKTSFPTHSHSIRRVGILAVAQDELSANGCFVENENRW